MGQASELMMGEIVILFRIECYTTYYEIMRYHYVVMILYYAMRVYAISMYLPIYI